jgi:hypothetical protein
VTFACAAITITVINTTTTTATATATAATAAATATAAAAAVVAAAGTLVGKKPFWLVRVASLRGLRTRKLASPQLNVHEFVQTPPLQLRPGEISAAAAELREHSLEGILQEQEQEQEKLKNKKIITI